MTSWCRAGAGRKADTVSAEQAATKGALLVTSVRLALEYVGELVLAGMRGQIDSRDRYRYRLSGSAKTHAGKTPLPGAALDPPAQSPAMTTDSYEGTLRGSAYYLGSRRVAWHCSRQTEGARRRFNRRHRQYCSPHAGHWRAEPRLSAWAEKLVHAIRVSF